MPSRNRRLPAAALAFGTLVLALLATWSADPFVAAADAGCGGTQYMRTHRRTRAQPPLAIGDSTMLLALPSLAARGIDANARGCRDFNEGLALLSYRRRHRWLPRVVILALGADASISTRQIGRALRILGRRRTLVLVTPRELGGWAGADAATIRRAGKRHPRYVVVLDWVRYSRGHAAWFQPDGLHLTFSGARAFARLLARALPLVKFPPWAPSHRRDRKRSRG